MSIDALREILAEVYGIKTEAELDEAIRKMKKLDITEILQGADELTATLTAEQLREKAQEMKETLGVDDVVIERQQVFITGGGRMTVNEMCSRCQHGIYCACAGSQDHYCGNYSPRYA